MIVLIDMDEVIADFEGGLLALWDEINPDRPLYSEGERSSFYIGSGTDTETAMQVNAIIHTHGFFETLKPIEGAKQAIEEMRELGHTPFILTSPGVSYPHAASEKYRWVEKHFGKYMLERLIITPAKPVVRGAILIDDRPEIEHEEFAEWEHVLYDKQYNRDVKNKRRLTWENWKEVLTELL